MPDWLKLIRAKTHLARAAADAPPSAEGLAKAASAGRVPHGQHQVKNFPVLDLGKRPVIRPADWRLRVYGLVERELTLDWLALLGMPQVARTSDFHCVTRWTRLDMNWQGVRARDVLAAAGPLAHAGFVTAHASDGYTTNLPLAALDADDALVAHKVLGRNLSTEHGGPVRLVVPALYGWKSAKWLCALELHAEDRPGFWETRGYHNDADPWKEQRYGWPKKAAKQP